MGRKGTAVLCAAAALLGGAGCTGLRLGPFGLGAPVLKAHRGVSVRPDWGPRDRYVIVWRITSRTTHRALMFVLPLPVFGAGSQLGSHSGRDEIFVVDLESGEGPSKLGDGEGPQICPRGTYVAYRHQPTNTPVQLHGRSVLPCRLWLANYATGEKWQLAPFVGSYAFSLDGRWLMWVADGTRYVAPPDEPSKARAFAAGILRARRDGWSPVHSRWLADGRYYAMLGKRAPGGSWGTMRWVRFAPPEWTMEELSEPPSEELIRRGSRDNWRGTREGMWSHDGTMILRTPSKTWEMPKLLSALFLPPTIVGVSNVHVEFADGTTRRLTHFRAPWW